MDSRSETSVRCSRTVLENNPLLALFEAIQDQQSNPGKRLCCVHCQAAITTEKDSIEVAGSHSFQVTNPAGFCFTIACFKHAWGCDILGKPTALHSWFPGYCWRYAHCLACEAHLGWCYENGVGNGRSDSLFFGLISDRLLPADCGA